MSTETNTFDLDLLTADFGDLPESATYRIPPTGVYGFKVTASVQMSKKSNPMVVAAYELLFIEKVQDGETAPIVGDKFSSYMTWNNEYGMKALREFLAPFVKHFNTGAITQLCGTLGNAEAPGEPGLITETTFVAAFTRTPRKDKGVIVDGEYNFRFRDVTIS